MSAEVASVCRVALPESSEVGAVKSSVCVRAPIVRHGRTAMRTPSEKRDREKSVPTHASALVVDMKVCLQVTHWMFIAEAFCGSQECTAGERETRAESQRPRAEWNASAGRRTALSCEVGPVFSLAFFSFFMAALAPCWPASIRDEDEDAS